MHGRAFGERDSAERSGSPPGGSIRSGGDPDRRQPALADALALELRQRAEQRLRVRVLRVVEQVERRALLDDPAGVHDDDVVGRLRDDAHVVGDDDHRHLVLVAEVLEQVEHLRLHGDVERGRRLVRDQELRVARERDRDHHALAHAAGEAVRIVVEPLAARSGCRTSSSSSIARLRACALDSRGGAASSP